ncbi:hypothetical protein [Agrobacterium pusense]|jgi:hypothetical protein|nr:hypothetical protein [Agrobacterium pusense]MBW9068876.1 hypothetical protein [Agrobacterium pusense]MBW9084174.1 hypothetical protein [Agrobacterium pusense]MBW9123496.1 hypothetical protein [Agrobacterium pusense]MBW9136083.1 hypothetical protein [Agrobacterium pusense]
MTTSSNMIAGPLAMRFFPFAEIVTGVLPPADPAAAISMDSKNAFPIRQ